MSGAICGGYTYERRRIHYCPTEDRKRRFWVTGASYYGTTWHCLGCGDRWQDGERGYRPYARGWREKAIAEYREAWSRIPAGLSPRPTMAEMGL